nr:flippase [Chloroflexia bacterium]
MSSVPRRIAGSFLAMAGGEMAARLLTLLATVRLARVLGLDAFGALAFAAAVVLYFLLLSDFGLDLFGTREVAVLGEGERKALVEVVLGLRLMAATVAPLVLVPLALVLPVSGETKALVALSGLSLLPLAVTLRWLFIGLERPGVVAWATIAGQAAFLLGTVLLVTDPGDVWRVPAVQAGGELLTAVILLVAARRRLGPFRPRLDLAAWRRILPQSLPTLGADVARTAVYTFDVVLLGLLLSEAVVGRYAAATRLLLLVIVFGRVYYLAVLPALTRALRGGNGPAGVATLHLVARGATLATAPMMAGGIVLAAPILGGLFGPDYAAAAPVFQILAPTVMLVVVGGACRHALLVLGRQRVDARNVAAGAALNIALNLVLIPTLHAAGAALATTIAEGAVLFWNRRAVMAAVAPLGLGPTLRSALGAAAVMAATLIPLRESPLVVSLPVGAAVYALALLVLDRQLPGQLRDMLAAPMPVGRAG